MMDNCISFCLISASMIMLRFSSFNAIHQAISIPIILRRLTLDYDE